MPVTAHRTYAIALIGAMTLSACGGGDAANTPPRQIDLAPSTPAQPQLADAPLPQAAPEKAPARTPETKRPTPPPVEKRAAEAPAPAPVAAAPVAAAPEAPPAPTTGAIASGTTFSLKPAVKVCTNTHKAGDRFTATLTSELTGTNGAVIPAGATAIVRIVEAPTSAPKDTAHLVFDVVSVRVGDQTYEVAAHVTQSAPMVRTSSQTTGQKATKVGTGAAIGAIAGRVLGGNTKSTVVGGVIGAAAGAAVAAGDQRYDGCLRDDGTITLALDRPLVIRLQP